MGIPILPVEPLLEADRGFSYGLTLAGEHPYAIWENCADEFTYILRDEVVGSSGAVDFALPTVARRHEKSSPIKVSQGSIPAQQRSQSPLVAL